MKKIIYTFAFIATSLCANAQVGIGTTTPNASAALDITSTTKGFLMPRLTTVQMNAISSPANGLQIYNTNTNTIWYYNNTQWLELATVYSASGNTVANTTVVNVTTPSGKIWMDRNLGASRAAISTDDYLAYGKLFQWGRADDGHADMIFTNATTATAINGATTTLSTTDTPGNSLFIKGGTSSDDWRSPGNDNLWQGVNGINNPCPSGYRVPTKVEWDNEISLNSINNLETAFSSPLKVVANGQRQYNGVFIGVGTRGQVWTSTILGTTAVGRKFDSSSSNYNIGRVTGNPVRCIKD